MEECKVWATLYLPQILWKECKFGLCGSQSAELDEAENEHTVL
jgi:hypothetical protein